MNAAPDSFHVMAKPSGALCNLDCRYCFYLDKETLFSPGTRTRMSDEVLEAYVRQYIETQRSSEVIFAWQGGEPTLMGVDFFEKAVRLQKRYAGGRRIQNAFQTNGVLLDDEWGAFLRREQFLVGLSIDGPAELHDLYRVDKGGRPSHARVMRGLEVLQRHGVEFNTLTVVHRENARHPLEVYRFLKEIGSKYLQFIPLVERLPGVASAAQGLTHAPPPSTASDEVQVTDWSVVPEDYGHFLTTIFDDWVKADVGRVFVQLFDVSLGIWMGQPSGLCLFAETCGDAVAIEHNGDVFSCDHFVYPSYRLGNVMNTGLGDLVRSDRQRDFGRAKAGTLPGYCQRCPVKFACNGECPKNRFAVTPDGEPGLNYLCAAYRQFFAHINPAMRGMAWLAMKGLSPAEIMTRGVPPGVKRIEA
ncbi:MAG TPA: anaerobic sulfatase maturase [Candidatus Limnocylindria bacterium]|nr:anaerobic sulfatase maturase [Candidatus Limnocylindria bacterium]